MGVWNIKIGQHLYINNTAIVRRVNTRTQAQNYFIKEKSSSPIHSGCYTVLDQCGT